MSIVKAGCIEIYDTAGYLRDCDYWGVGGVMVHELCHAYHNKHIAGGFNNERIMGVSVVVGVGCSLELVVIVVMCMCIHVYVLYTVVVVCILT